MPVDVKSVLLQIIITEEEKYESNVAHCGCNQLVGKESLVLHLK
jgi:hypothetical protein